MSKCGRPLPGSEAQPQPDQRRGPQAARGLGWQREGGSSMRWLCHTDRAHVLRQAIQACRKGGTLSIPGVYGGLLDSVPFGAAFAKGLTLRMGQTHVHRYLRPLLQRIQQGEIDPTFLISHRLPLAEAPRAYRLFRDKQQACIKVVLDPWQKAA